MKKITKYKASDGVEFLDETECRLHEVNCKTAEDIMSVLCARPSSCDFSNGSGFLQHDKNLILKTRNRLLEFVKRYSDHHWIQEAIDKGFEADSSWAGRIIGECAPQSIYKHWGRLSCIDKSFREWGQPFYAINPDKAKQVQLN